MPTPLSSVVALLALAFASPALCGSSVDIRVSGGLVPSACMPILSLASLHFGTLTAHDLDDDHQTPLVEHTRTLTVTCGAPTLYGLRLLDNRLGSAYDSGRLGALGMGYTPAGERIGAYYLEVIPGQSTIDGRPVFLSLGDRTGSRWGTSTAQNLMMPADGTLLGLVDQAGVDTGAVAVELAQLSVRAHGVVAPARNLTLVDAVPLDGQVTVEVVYL